MKFFSYASRFSQLMLKLSYCCCPNFLWLICALPVVTFGASTAAAFSVTLKMTQDREGYIARDFFRAFRENLRRGIPLGLLFLAALYALYLDVQILGAAEAHEGLLLAMLILFVFVFVMAFLYAFALLARYDNSLTATLRNSYRIGIRFFPRTIACVLLCAVETGLFLWNRILIFVGFLIAPVCIMLTISGFAMAIFRRLEQEPGAVSNPEKLREEEGE